MHIECNSLVERFRTVRTRVLLFIAMNFQMTAQVSFVIEQFITFWTFGRKFFGPLVHRHMIFEISQLRESFATLCALVFRRFMCSLMRLQYLAAFEYFIAHGASQIDIVCHCFCAARFIFHMNDVIVVVDLGEIVIQAKINSEIFNVLADRIHSIVLFIFIGKHGIHIGMIVTIVEGIRVDYISTNRIKLPTIVDS